MRRPLSYRNQSIDLLCKSMDWFLYDNDLRHERVKGSFISQNIYVFVTTFWYCRKNDLISEIRQTSKFMTSQRGLQAIAIHILPNISQSKGNQTIKFGQLIEYNKRDMFFKKLCGK